MRNATLLAACIAGILATSAAQAGVDLIATGSISGTYEDYSVETAGALESGVPGNGLGGMGSAIAYAGCNSFVALPDRGPNALTYNAAIDSTTTFIPRFHALHLSLASAPEGASLPSGRVANKGMEGLAITPDGKSLVGAMQSPLIQDGGTDAPFLRLVKIDIRTGAVREYAYELTNIGTAAKPKYGTVSEILAISNDEFLVDERDGKGLGDNSVAVFKRLFRVSLKGATEVSSLTGAAQLAGKASVKTLFLDVVAALNAHGYASTDIPAKLEGIAFGAPITQDGVSRQTLFIANDNDFLATFADAGHPQGGDNPNRWFVFAFDQADLPTYRPQPLETTHSCTEDHGSWDEWFRGATDRARAQPAAESIP
jgi:hypothetical protein